MSDTTAGTVVLPATAERWADVETVMGTRGDPAGCWCQYFRLSPQEWRASTKQSNKEALCEQVTSSSSSPSSSPAPGVLAYQDGAPVGWCAISPKSNYQRLTARQFQAAGHEGDEGVWVVTCFVVRVGHRRTGVAGELLTGAIQYAKENGAQVIEAYPVDVSARESVTSAELFRGTLGMFEKAGFVEVARPSPARAIMQLEM